MSSYYRQQLEEYLALQDLKGKSVLDVGAGDRLARDRVNSLDHEIYQTLDIDDSNKPDFVWNLNFQEYADNLFGRRFDIIFCLEVFEYIWDPVRAIFNLWDWLNPKGTLIVSFPFIYPVHQPVEADCLRYTRKAVEWYMAIPWSKGFKEYQIIPRYATVGSPDLHNFFANEKMHAAKGQQHDIIGWIVKATK